MVLYYTPAFFIKVFRCNPIHKIWDIMAPGKCIASDSTIFVADCTISIVTNLAIFNATDALSMAAQNFCERNLRIMVVFAGGAL